MIFQTVCRYQSCILHYPTTTIIKFSTVRINLALLLHHEILNVELNTSSNPTNIVPRHVDFPLCTTVKRIQGRCFYQNAHGREGCNLFAHVSDLESPSYEKNIPEQECRLSGAHHAVQCYEIWQVTVQLGMPLVLIAAEQSISSQQILKRCEMVVQPFVFCLASCLFDHHDASSSLHVPLQRRAHHVAASYMMQDMRRREDIWSSAEDHELLRVNTCTAIGTECTNT